MKPNLFVSILITIFSVASHGSEEIIKRKNYTLNYNEDHEIANWVSYELDRNKLKNCTKRTDNFRADPNVSTGSAIESDYKGSGLDRGHLVPAGDMKHTKEAMSETFFYSNMTPQPANFNRVTWAKLENLLRSWGQIYNKIWIVTGPILRNNLRVIGDKNQVSVPEEYFKVIIKKNNVGKYEGIAFLMPTKVPTNDLKYYVRSINDIEELTGFDYFQFLDDSSEERIENRSDINKWNFNGSFEYLPCTPIT